MITFFDYLRKRNIEIPEGNISDEWFHKYGYPMIVRCSCCGMTMATPSALIDNLGYTYCPNCAENN